MIAAFHLPQQPLIEFDENTHTYYVDGEAFPSVTQVLKGVGYVNDEWFTEYGRWRGSAAHRACELADRGKLDKRTLDPAIAPRLAAWRAFLNGTGFEVGLVEEQVVCMTAGYAGRLDRTGRFPKAKSDAPVIIDQKCYRPQWWAAQQMAAYGYALDPTAVFRRIGVELCADGTYSSVEYPLEAYWDDVHDFLAAVRTIRCRERHS